MDQIKPDLRDMRSTESVNLIHPGHPDLQKIISR